jgi:hypothetical protein
MNLTVMNIRGDYSILACQSSVTGYVGAITCNTSGYSGSLVGTVYRTASPQTAVAQLIATISSTPFKSSFGLFLALLIAIPIIFVLVLVSPVAAVIGGVIALVPALYFGSVTWGIVSALAIGGFIVIHFINRR